MGTPAELMGNYPLEWLVLLVDALAAARVTRLLTLDTVTAPWRFAVYRFAYRNRGDEGDLTRRRMVEDGDWDDLVDRDMDENPNTMPKLAYLVRCPWCTGMYVSAPVVAARCLIPGVWQPVAAFLAVAAVVGWTANLTP